MTWCSLGFHDWNMWAIIEAILPNGLPVATKSTRQQRQCRRCGLYQHRKLPRG